MDFVPPQIYDKALESSMFEFDNGKMKMNMDLDLNGNSINAPFFITGYSKKTKNDNRILLSGEISNLVIPFDCVLKEIYCYFLNSHSKGRQVTLTIYRGIYPIRSQTIHSSSNDYIQVFPSGFTFSKNNVLWITIFKMNTSETVKIDEIAFTLYFTPQ